MTEPTIIDVHKPAVCPECGEQMTLEFEGDMKHYWWRCQCKYETEHKHIDPDNTWLKRTTEGKLFERVKLKDLVK